VPSLAGDPQVRILLLDIEGTTTPIEFVYQTLFPYVVDKMDTFLHEHSRESEVSSLIQQLHMQNQLDERLGVRPPPWTDESGEARLRSCIAYCRWQMARDSKSTPLKSLQGKIWQEGYTRGQLHGQVYSDVPPAFTRWRLQKREICIYSSGSVLAQQLLFRTVSSGDLTRQIAAYFDTNVGPKAEAGSYRKIAESLAQDPYYFLFISDAAKEVGAASDAGMQAIICNRDIRSSLSHEGKPFIRSFDEVFPNKCKPQSEKASRIA
jgi:enolase-phosphatase E1